MTGAAAGTALCVVCEEYDGDGFPPLVGAMAQMDKILGLLEGLGYETRKVGGGNPSAAAFDDESEEWSSGWLATGDSKPALVIWSGHGVRVDGETRLVLSDLKRVAGSGQWKTRARRQGVTADDLVSAALDSGAEHILLIIDTCYAGGGVVPALRLATSRGEKESAPPGHAKWLGFLASCQSHETSDGSGPLLTALTEVLEAGPAGNEYRSVWSDHNAFVSGPDLVSAIASRWDEGQGQTLVPASVGDARPAFPNPLHSPEAPARLVEHLVQAARGVGHREEGWFFTGRTGVLGRIVEWLDEDAPGLYLVTGPAGCGKSAVLGRIATLADPEQRARAVESGALRDGDPDPGVRPERTLAAVHLRDLTPLQAAERLARDLGLPRPRSTDDFRAEVRELSPQPVLVMDGLDEVPAEHTQSMIEELVFPLSRSVPVLLGSRERVFRNKLEDNESLVQALSRHIGAGVEAVDLEEEPHTQEDIGEYVRRRCEAAGMAEGPAREAGAAIAERATDVGGGFLFARLVTSTVLARVGSGDDGSLLAELPDSIDAAFENELRAVPARVRGDGTVLPSAAWDLLSALAWTVGQGMPAGGVWEAVAGALGGDVEYDESDVDWALSAFGRYIVEDAEEGQAVYRLYHREFVAHLRRRAWPGGKNADDVVLRTLVDLIKRQGQVGDWSGVDPYVTRGLVAHAVGRGAAGVEVLRGVAAWDEGCGLPYLAEGLHELSLVLSEARLRDEALECSREAVGLYEGLNAISPKTYLSALATSLNNLAAYLAETGDRQGALEPAHEAVRIRRTLAQQHPTAFLPGLAGSLNNLANHLAETGDRQGALEPAHEAVRIRRTLAQQHPTAFLPALAMSLNNLANHLADTGDRQGALEPAHEAVRIRRTLAQQHPTIYTPALAMSLNNLANRLGETGDRQGSLEPAHEAVHLYRTLAQQHPAAFLPDLAMSLNNLATHLAETGDAQGALEPAHEAVRIRRTLAQQHPAAFLPNLATSLNNLAAHLANTGDRQGALERAHEAVRLYRTLAQQHPAAFLPDLAMSLNNLAARLAETGDRQGALEPVHEAVRLYRTLAQQHPAAFLPNLAGSLNNLATHLAETGDAQAALEPAHEAVRIRRTLAQQHPAAFLPALATSLNNLANHLADTGDPTAAVQTFEQAIADLGAKVPAGGRALTLDRDKFLIHRPECSTTAGLRGLTQLANNPTAEAPDQVTFQARSSLREFAQESAAHHDELAAAWDNESTTPLPDWLALSPHALDIVIAWMETSTWADSYAHWTDHAELLSSREAAVALAEFTVLTPEAAAAHQALREEVLTHGAPTAFRLLILGEQLDDWAALTTWDESEQYLRAHPDLLELDPPDSVPAALLHAARAHDIPTAYALVRDRTALQQYVQDALTNGDAEALRHAASIEDEVYDDQLSARTHHQAALILAGTPEDPADLAPLVADAPPDTRNRLISEIAALSAAHAPQHAAHWVRIIQALAATG
ncbi:tetratricopeptide repeat protein [Streptomyces sp. NPDC091040]|uniref:tetratricopeptide repeat protein n=1 Tax=Streptomyces sp. NPDC091040 TaxID=3365972 RepID=UPI00382E24AF